MGESVAAAINENNDKVLRKMMAKRARVLIDCRDAKGLVYQISKVFYDRDLNIENNREFVDSEQGKFFMRSVVTGSFDTEELHRSSPYSPWFPKMPTSR